MKKKLLKGIFLFLFILSLAFIVRAAGTATTVTIPWSWLPDNTQMAGLSTNDYMTNLTAIIVSTTNVQTPVNQWQAVGTYSLTSMLSQGPPGTVWNSVLTMDANSRFYGMIVTNGNGGSSPFSNLAPGLTAPAAGVIVLPLKVK